MKKIQLISLFLLFSLLLAGCAGAVRLGDISLPPFAEKLLARFSQDETADDGGTIIYRVSLSEDDRREDLIQTESCAAGDAAPTEIDGVLTLFASPSRKAGLACALPEGVSIEGWFQENRVVTLVFSPEFLAVPAMEQTVAALCAALTLCELDSVESVTVTSGGETLFSNLVPEDALLSDSDDDPYVRQLRLYFADSQGRYLVSEYHTLTLDEDSSPERYVVEELLRGPNSSDLTSPIPAGTTLVSCATVDGICVVNLSADFYKNRPHTALGERLAIYSIVNSLTALSGVDGVNLLVEGQPVDTYVYRSLAEPLAWYEEAIGPVSAAKGETDTNLYLVTPELNAITALPFRTDTLNYESRAEAVLSGLLTAAEPGYPSLFSGSGSVTDITVQGPFCTVDLAESFFASLPAEARNAAVQSIAATLCDLGEIASVSFTIGSEPAVFEGTDWSGPWSQFEEIEVE